MEISYTVRLAKSFPEALAATKAALAKEGFGVLAEIDVQAAMKEKMGADYAPYVILGACNPGLAHRALSARKDIGLFLPCNVIAYEEGDRVVIEAIRPTAAMSMLDDTALASVAAEAEEKLQRVIASLAA
ncbi:MAG: DUF302 domain-containing protein [Patescibacteria group bacterium]|nr:DUF302 domain-containing protein [Patescibacteria group bacterium]